MAMKFYYTEIKWSKARNEVTFVGAYLGKGRGKRFAVDGLKRVLMPNQKLYLCKILKKLQNGHEDNYYKMFVLDEHTLSNFEEDNRQLVGTNKNGSFMLDSEFMDGLKKITSMERIDKVSLGDFKRET